jgi:hypothetical protein
MAGPVIDATEKDGLSTPDYEKMAKNFILV